MDGPARRCADAGDETGATAMILWLILGAMCAAVAAVLLFGLRPGGARPPERAEHDLAVYRAQLKELERDHARGVIGPGRSWSRACAATSRIRPSNAARCRSGSNPDSGSGRRPLGRSGVSVGMGDGVE